MSEFCWKNVLYKDNKVLCELYNNLVPRMNMDALFIQLLEYAAMIIKEKNVHYIVIMDYWKILEV